MIYDIQKASALKRLSALILDFILLLILATGAAYASSLIFNIDSHQANLQEKYKYYEETYNVSFDLKQEDFDNMSEEERAHYDEVEQIINHDEEFIKENQLVINLTFVIILIGVLFGVLIVEFVIPIIFKNGQTIGKKVFSLIVIKNNSVRVTNFQMFVRTIFGKFIIELIVPIYFIIMTMYGIVGYIGPIIVIALLILQVVLLIFTKYGTPIHDILAFTCVADKESQMIFENEDELAHYKGKLHAESVAKDKY